MNSLATQKLSSLSVMMVMLAIFSLSAFSEASAQCLNTAQFGSIAAPVTQGNFINITTCAFGGEYSTINNVVAGATYTLASSVATDFITVRQGTFDGLVLGTGTGSVTVTPTVSGPIYMHVNTNSACGTQSTCRTTSVRLDQQNGNPPVAPVPISGWSLYVGMGLVLLFLTSRFYGRSA